jgi:hypothetical protein
MKNTKRTHRVGLTCAGDPKTNAIAWSAPRLGLLVAALLAGGFYGQTAKAQFSVSITPQPLNYWAGLNTSNTLVIGNVQVGVKHADGTTTENLAVSPAVGGLTAALSATAITNSQSVYLTNSVVNATPGYHAMAIEGSGGFSVSAPFNLFVVPQWTNDATGFSGNWSDISQWSGGSVPTSNDGVYYEHYLVGPATNVVDGSQTIQSLAYLGLVDDGASASKGVHTVIPSGVTLSVLGTNGFHIGDKISNGGKKPEYVFEGDGTLLVSNTAAQFTIVSANGNNTRWLRADMSGLANLDVHVKQVAIMDQIANHDAAVDAGLVDWVLAKTNLIEATLTDDYNAATFDTSISYNRQVKSANNGQYNNAQLRLGDDTKFYADSIGIGIGNANGTSSGTLNNRVGYRMAFNNADSTAPTSEVVFRNTDGVSRMSLLAIGVDQGLDTAAAANRGVMDLRGGITDMLVDQIWLGQDRTNSADAHGYDCNGQLFFDWGKINCNTCIVGNMKYTNNISVSKGVVGSLYVGTNGIMAVNDNLILGLTPTNVDGFEAQAAATAGAVEVANGGTLRAKQITVGEFSGANAITVDSGGNLVVSNTIATAAVALGKLTVNNGGQLTLHKDGANTLVYVTNLVASSGVINIASVSGSGSFAPIIRYAPGGGETASFVAGSVPSGYSATIFNDTSAHTIDLTLIQGSPKHLMWKGDVNNTWDNATKNWVDLDTGLHTNFTTGDSVVFDDSANSFNINVSEDVVPLQASGMDGMIMTNNSHTYVFSGSGGIRGAASFAKYGAGTLEVDNYSEVAITVNQGSLTGAGTIGSALLSPGTACSWQPGGNVLGEIIVNDGVLTNFGTIGSGLAILNGGVVTNMGGGNIVGGLAMDTNTFLGNAGTLTDIGSPTISSNSVVVNSGYIYGTALSVSGTLKDSGAGSIGMNTALTINSGGTFIPGGDGIGTSTVYEYPLGTGGLAGRVVFATGSTNIFKVDMDSGVQNTVLRSVIMSFGPNQSSVAFNGGTIQMENVGSTPFAAGQTFPLVQYDYDTGYIVNAGLNSTNSYPVMSPASPGPGLAWDLSTAPFDGVVRIKSIATTPTNLMYTASTQTQITSSSTNSIIVNEFKWPSDYTGWRLLQLQTTLTNGLSATNWVEIGNARFTNDIVLTNTVTTNSAVFYRMVYP